MLKKLKITITAFILIAIALSSVTAWAGLTQTEVSQLYVAIFGRASEGEGNAYWQSQATMSTAANTMLDTQAAKDYFGANLNTNQAFIQHIYLLTLNKTIADDSVGIDYWVGELNDGKSRGQVVASLIEVIKNYAPSGLYYNANDAATVAAYNQFTNRVVVSDYMADTVVKAPADWATSTKFDSAGLNVTDDVNAISSAKVLVDNFASRCSISMSRIHYQDSAGRKIDYDFSSGEINSYISGDTLISYSTIEIPANFILGRGPTESETKFTWGEHLEARTNPILGDGFLSITIDQANSVVDDVAGMWALGCMCSLSLCADLADAPLDWDFEARISNFSGTDKEDHLLGLSIGGGSSDTVDLSPYIWVSWFKGWYEGVYYDNVLNFKAIVEDSSTGTEWQSDSILLYGQNPASTIIDVKLQVTAGTSFVAQYRLNDGPWQQIWQHTISSGKMHGFPELKPYIELSSEKN
jgi:hypothetical protein